MYRSLYLLCSIVLPVLGFALAGRADEASEAVVYVVSYIEVMPPSTGEAITLFRQYREASRKESGNMRLEVLQQSGRPDHFALVEVWKDQQTFEAHGRAAAGAMITGMITAARS
jgi:quinol monooxygenase YgiN